MMQKQLHFKCILHIENPSPGRYREIEVVEHTDHFELLIFEGDSLRSDQSTIEQHDWQSVSFPPTRDAGCAAAGDEKRKSLSDGWRIVQSVEC
jgi:hypothetical protein